MKVSVDQDKCIGSGQCVSLCPEVFDQRDEDGIVVLRDADPPSELDDVVEEAAQVCPSLAIRVEE
jgi:ferredoxin